MSNHKMAECVVLLGILLCASPLAAQNPPVIQSGQVTPGHAVQWITNGVVGDGGALGGPIFTGPTTLNDFACVGSAGTIVDCGLSSTGTNNWTGLQNFNGGATAPTRSAGDSTTNVATTAFVQATLGPGGTRTRLTTATTFFLNPVNGNDSFCTGLVNAAYVSGTYPQACSWLTPQGAVNSLKTNYDLAGFQATVQFADGSGGNYTSTGPVIDISGPFVGAQALLIPLTSASCPIIFKGNTATPANVVLASTGSDTVVVAAGAYACFQDMKITSVGGGSDMVSAGGAVIRFGNLIFGQSAGAKLRASHGAVAENYSSFTVQDNSTGWFYALDLGGILIGAGATNVITVGNSHTNSVATAIVDDGGNISLNGASYSLGGFTVTGSRFSITSTGSITDGGSSLPGSIPGTTAGSITGFGSYNGLPVQTTVIGVNSSDTTGPLQPTGTVFVGRASNGLNTAVDLQAFAGVPIFVGRRADGTAASPTAAQSGETLSAFSGNGYGATGFPVNNPAGMLAVAEENFSDTANGTRLVFKTTPKTTVSAATAMTMWGSGGVSLGTGVDPGLGSFVATGTVAVNQSGVTGPVQPTGSVFVGRATDGVNTTIDLESFGISSSIFVGRRAAGTAASPTAAQSGNFLSVFAGNGYGATGFPANNPGAVVVTASENFSDTANGTRLDFYTTPNTTATFQKSWTMDHNGALFALNATGGNKGQGTINAHTGIWIDNVAVLTGNQTITLSGDITGSGTTAITTTLATVNSNVGTFGSATQSSQVTVNGKGLVTAAANVTVTPAVGSITGLGTNVATALGVNIGSAGSVLLNRSTTNSNIGLGTETNPQSPLVFSTNTATGIAAPLVGTIAQFNGKDGGDASGLSVVAQTAFAGIPIYVGVRADGTAASKTAVQLNETLFEFATLGYTGAAYYNSVNLVFLATETFSGSAGGGALDIYTTPNTTQAIARAARFQASGGFSVGTATDPGIGSLQLNAQMFLPNITTSSAAQNGTVCWTTGTGKFTVDTTVGCLTSLEEAKDIIANLEPTDALDIANKLNPFSFRYKSGWGDNGHYEQFGLGAHQVASVDERLAGRDPNGTLQGVRYQELTAVLVGAIKQLKADNDNIRAEIRRRLQ